MQEWMDVGLKGVRHTVPPDNEERMGSCRESGKSSHTDSNPLVPPIQFLSFPLELCVQGTGVQTPQKL